MQEKLDPTEDRSGEAEPPTEPQNLIDFMQSSPLAEAIASGELDPAVFERPRDMGREPISFDWETDA